MGVDLAVAAHAEQLAGHGGTAGLRDWSTLESALARPRDLVAYGEPDIAELTASYIFGIARNHSFVDGNKRTAVVSETLLMLNSHQLTCSAVELVITFMARGRRTAVEAIANGPDTMSLPPDGIGCAAIWPSANFSPGTRCGGCGATRG